MDPATYCHDICKKSGSNFFYSFYLLPKNRRQAMEAFYAFCRLVDDAIDEADSKEGAAIELKSWRQELGKLYQGQPKHPVTRALLPAIQAFKIPREYLEEIISGCEMDLSKKRYDNHEELQQYCYRVASCVGIVCLYIFGAEISDQSRQAAISLGLAVQLTNILRDIKGDLDMDRIYLPQEDLSRFGLGPKELADPEQNRERLVDFILYEVAQAEALYQKAWSAFPQHQPQKRKLIAARMMGTTYQTLLKKIRRDPLRAFKKRVSLSAPHKVAILINSIARSYLS
jgi:15-cis-phytoene synthase